MSKMTLQERFDKLTKLVQSLPKDGYFQIPNDKKLEFYAWFKQATIGPCNTSKPSLLNPIERMKWKAWKDLGNMTKEQAMEAYIKETRRGLSMEPRNEKDVEEIEKNKETHEILKELVFY